MRKIYLVVFWEALVLLEPCVLIVQMEKGLSLKKYLSSMSELCDDILHR